MSEPNECPSCGPIMKPEYPKPAVDPDEDLAKALRDAYFVSGAMYGNTLDLTAWRKVARKAREMLK